MYRLPIIFRWLALVAAADWLIARTFTRSAIFMPKAPPMLVAYQVLSFVGQLASTLAGLLALMAVMWIAWHSWRTRRTIGLSLTVWGLVALGLAALFYTPGGWLAAGYQWLVVTAVAILAGQAWSRDRDIRERMVWSIPALAILSGSLYHASQALYTALRWPGPTPFTSMLFSLGELFVVLSPIGLWCVYRRAARQMVGPYLWAALPVFVFVAMYVGSPAVTGIMSIWSMGLTLYLPWPVYVLSLWLAGVMIIDSMRRGGATGWAILLLAAAGYAPQMSTYVLASLIALWMLAAPASPRVTASAPAARLAQPSVAPQAAPEVIGP